MRDEVHMKVTRDLVRSKEVASERCVGAHEEVRLVSFNDLFSCTGSGPKDDLVLIERSITSTVHPIEHGYA
jgi:hypothetical protein